MAEKAEQTKRPLYLVAMQKQCDDLIESYRKAKALADKWDDPIAKIEVELREAHIESQQSSQASQASQEQAATQQADQEQTTEQFIADMRRKWKQQQSRGHAPPTQTATPTASPFTLAGLVCLCFS
jgi:hypothetical protein